LDKAAGGVSAAGGIGLERQGITDKLTLGVARTLIGGAASVAGGGKFANGATTAAFAYLFNDLADMRRGRAAHRIWGEYYENKDPGFTANTSLKIQVGFGGYGRPDLTYGGGGSPIRDAWELKPMSDQAGPGYVAATVQMTNYINNANGMLISGGAERLFGGAPSLTLAGNAYLGRWQFTYTYDSINTATPSGLVFYDGVRTGEWVEDLVRDLNKSARDSFYGPLPGGFRPPVIP
jgi:hypothetical protein